MCYKSCLHPLKAGISRNLIIYCIFVSLVLSKYFGTIIPSMRTPIISMIVGNSRSYISEGY